MMCCSLHRVRAMDVLVTGGVHMISRLGGVCQVSPRKVPVDGKGFFFVMNAYWDTWRLCKYPTS